VFCDRIIAVSEKTRTHHLQSGKLDPDKVITLYNGVDISRFRNIDKVQIIKTKQALNLPLDSPIIITVAVLREPKGIQNMIKALPSILEQFPDLHYLIVGDGNHGETLRELVSALTLEDHVTFAGHRTDIPALLACSDLFVLPTLKDALPTVLIEALAAEIPIVATNVGGVPEIIENGVDGLLVLPDDPASLAKACLQLLKNDEQVQQITSTGSQIVQQRFSINVQIEKLSKLYKELSSYGK
jgi:glycosyltransferase involved in cell wall biosynthesis